MSNRLILTENHPAGFSDHLPLRLLYFRSLRLDTWAIRNVRSAFWRLYCNLDPGAEIRLGRKRYRLGPGKVFLIPAWIKWEGDAPKGVRHIYAHFDLPGLTAGFCREFFPAPVCVFPPGKQHKDTATLNLTRELESLSAAYGGPASDPDPVKICWAKSLIYWSLREAFGRLPTRQRTRCMRMTAGRHPLNHVLLHIENHLGEDLSNDQLAAVVPCSRSHLVRLFREHLGMAPAAYVIERRVSVASDLLYHGEASIDQIALHCGFPNRSYFSRVFAREIGIPPARFRKLGTFRKSNSKA